MISVKQNVILHGDCLALLEDIPDNSLDLIVTDPPFNVMNTHNLTFTTRSDIVQTADFDQFASYEEYIAFIDQWMTVMVRKMKTPSTLYCFFATQYITDLLRIGERLGLVRKNVIAWVKTNPALHIHKTNYLSSYESCVMMVKDYPTFNFTNQADMHNVIITGLCPPKERLKDDDDDTLHPTQKRLDVIEHLIEVSSNPGDVVCDPFSGSGTTNAACAKMGRYCIGIEQDVKYYTASIARLKKIQVQYGKTHQQSLRAFVRAKTNEN